MLGGGVVDHSKPPSAVWIPPPESFKRRADFATNDEYAVYVRDHIQARSRRASYLCETEEV